MWCLSCFHVKTAQQTFMKFSSLHRLILIWIGIFKLYPTFRTELNIKLIKIRRDLTTEKEEKNSSALVTDTKIMQPVYAFIFLSSRWQKREKTQSARAQAFVLAGKKRFEVTNFEILCAPRIPSLVPYIRPVRIEKKTIVWSWKIVWKWISFSLLFVTCQYEAALNTKFFCVRSLKF